MKTAFSNRFLKDLDKLPDDTTKSAVADIIEQVEAAAKLADVQQVKNWLASKQPVTSESVISV